jgi:hypothetical protein
VLELSGGIGLIATRGTQALRIRTIIRGVLGHGVAAPGPQRNG